MRIMHVHAHFDDYEFVAAGTFETWRRKLGDQLRARVLVCTDGKAGHHARTREETGWVRAAEQEASAKIGKYEVERLRYHDGSVPREACLQVTSNLLAALWRSIREFEPDYLFCPPLPPDPLSGVHNDHVTIADAVRRVAYMINVPHAFTPEYPANETTSAPCKVPVILNVYDGYLSGNTAFDLAIDVEDVMPVVCEMSWCHQSQVTEWLPWVGRHGLRAPASLDEWSLLLRDRVRRRNDELGIASNRATEVFTLTAWGMVPSYEQVMKDFPNILQEASHLDNLWKRLKRWES